MYRRLVTLLLALVLFVPIVSVSAESVQPRYSHVYSITAGIDLNGSTVSLVGAGAAKYDYTYTYLYVTLLRRPQNGGNWGPVTSWNDQTTGLLPIQIYRDVTVAQGYDYRVYVNIQIKDETGYILDSVGMYSDTVSYHTTTTTTP